MSGRCALSGGAPRASNFDAVPLERPQPDAIAAFVRQSGHTVQNVQPLVGGYGDSFNYLVETDICRAVCKVRADGRRGPHRVFIHASRIMALRNVPHGRVLSGPGNVGSLSAILVEYVDGRSLDSPTAQIGDEWRFGVELARWLRRLHSTRSYAFAWEPKSRRLFQTRLEAAVQLGLDDCLSRRLVRLWATIEPSLGNIACSLVHRDLQESNILELDGRFGGVIDFEQCRVADPLYDHVKLGSGLLARSEEIRAAFAAEYGLADDRRTRDRLTAVGVLEHLAGVRYFARKRDSAGMAGARAKLEQLVGS